jgi:tetratricopeptide (TPR) repeat protein
MLFKSKSLINATIFLVLLTAPSIAWSKNHISLFQKGLTEYENGNIDNAIRLFDKIIELNPSLSDAYTKRGDARLSFHQFKEAIQDYTQAIKLDSSSIYSYTERALLYEILGDKKKAYKDYQSAAKIPVSSSKEYAEKGYLLLKENKYDSALEFLNRSISLDPKNIDAYLWRALAYERIKKFHKAIIDYDLAININPKYTYIYIRKWNIYKKILRSQDQAESNFNKAEKINYAYTNIQAGSYLSGVNNIESLKYLDKVINSENGYIKHTMKGVTYNLILNIMSKQFIIAKNILN